MCGRFTQRHSGREVAEHFELGETPELEPRYNAAPGQEVAAVRAGTGGVCRLDLLRWGLVPPGAHDPRIGSRLINARSETAATRPAFSRAFRARRCIVPADGFYEWGGPRSARRAHHVRLPGGGLFGIAGLWEIWRGPEGHSVESCTLLTTDANATVRAIHDRMPVILAPDAYGPWLDPGVEDPELLSAFLRPLPDDALELCPVGTRVNRVEFDDPACLDPPPPPVQGALF